MALKNLRKFSNFKQAKKKKKNVSAHAISVAHESW